MRRTAAIAALTLTLTLIAGPASATGRYCGTHTSINWITGLTQAFAWETTPHTNGRHRHVYGHSNIYTAAPNYYDTHTCPAH